MPTEVFCDKIRHKIPSLINMLCNLDQGTQDSAASALAELAKHGKQELKVIVAGVTSNECQQSPFITRLGLQYSL